MRLIMAGIWIMVAATLSIFVAEPLGYGMASGALFLGGMLLLWIGGGLVICRSIARRLLSIMNGR